MGSEDAPGWSCFSSNSRAALTSTLGPVCWKCSGRKQIEKKKNIITCTVCFGVGRLKKKNQAAKKLRKSKSRKRKLPDGYTIPGPQKLYIFRLILFLAIP